MRFLLLVMSLLVSPGAFADCEREFIIEGGYKDRNLTIRSELVPFSDTIQFWLSHTFAMPGSIGPLTAFGIQYILPESASLGGMPTAITPDQIIDAIVSQSSNKCGEAGCVMVHTLMYETSEDVLSAYQATGLPVELKNGEGSDLILIPADDIRCFLLAADSVYGVRP